jgi:hypothetical protein
VAQCFFKCVKNFTKKINIENSLVFTYSTSMTNAQSKFAKSKSGLELRGGLPEVLQKLVDDFLGPYVVLDGSEVAFPEDILLGKKIGLAHWIHFVNGFPLKWSDLMAISRSWRVGVTGPAVLPPWCMNAFSGVHFARGTDLSGFNASGMRKATEMFAGIKNEGPIGIGEWETIELTDMRQMFEHAESFVDNLSKWKVFKVTSTQLAFHGALLFNSNLTAWDLTRRDTYGMFSGATSFDPSNKPKGLLYADLA